MENPGREYQQMKEEPGLDRFEGRGWRGFYHHCAPVMPAFGFPAMEHRRARRKQRVPALKKEKNVPPQRC